MATSTAAGTEVSTSVVIAAQAIDTQVTGTYFARTQAIASKVVGVQSEVQGFIFSCHLMNVSLTFGSYGDCCDG